MNDNDNEQKGAALVVGDAGVTGRHVAEEYLRRGWQVRGVSRRPLEDAAWEHYSVDLLSPPKASDFTPFRSTTHLAFAAYIERAERHSQTADNLALLKHTLDGLGAVDAPVTHVTLFQGGKAYGVHHGYFNSPGKERDPRLIQDHFYYAQEDLLRELSAERGFSFTALRPEATSGYGVGNPMNILMVIAVYASICRELRTPFRFPGTLRAYDALTQITDAELLGRATVWAGSEPGAKNEVFNITNGDVFRWRQLWPSFARHFGVEYAEPQPLLLSETMDDYRTLWAELVARHGLVDIPWSELVPWGFGDLVFRAEFDNITSTVKARLAGFHDAMDTEDRFLELFDRLAQRRIIPPFDV